MKKHTNEPRTSISCAVCGKEKEMRVSLVQPCDYYICHTCIKLGRNKEKPCTPGFARTVYPTAATEFDGYIEVPYRAKVSLDSYGPYD
jgi:late competence protein required for DNA uptake (superfamily II DNA/RNA helicase)